LAETYYEAVRYFRAQSSAFNRQNYSRLDPIQVRCQKNFVLLITDGESTKDQNLPGTCFHHGRHPVTDSELNIKEWMDKIAENEGTSSLRCTNANGAQGTYYLEGVAYYSHVSDLREDFKGTQNLTLYDVFVFDESPVGRELLRKAAKYGGFQDFNGNGVPDLHSEWDQNGDGVPDNYYEAQDGYKIEEAITKVIEDIIKRASGTSASILPEKSQKGAVLHQTVFYHKKTENGHNLSWVGYVYTWWFLNTKIAQNIREDTKSDKVLEINEDRILSWFLDEETGDLTIKAYSSTPEGQPDDLVATYSSFDETTPLWEGGEILAATPADERKIFTTDGRELVAFNVKNLDKFRAELGNPLNFPACLGSNPENLVEYIRGKHIEGCRDRRIDSETVWKLGDVVYSSPTIVSYDDYSVVFVGANDGMLHAFKVGYLKNLGKRSTPVRLQDSYSESSSATLGQELWAFIPKNALPYLRFLADTDYCHLYYVDLKPFVLRVDTDGDGLEDKTILIGGMRLGGASNCSACFSSDCVSPPDDVDGGYSSYFALDVTSPESPKFLWEFTDRDLGFAYTGPAIVKKGTKYYAVFATGPTDYKGDSCKSLKFFVVDLLSGKEVAVIDSYLTHSFGGRLLKEGYDYNGDGNTDYVFVGFTKKTIAGYTGGIVMLDTRDVNPSDWKVTVVDSIYDRSSGNTISLGPVTAKVVVNECFNQPYVYFGTGRWFYKTDSTDITDRLVALPLNCNASGCTVVTEVINSSEESGSEEVCSQLQEGAKLGWYIELNTSDEGYLSERVITDPTKTSLDVAIFTSIEPTSDVCGFGGRTRMWLLNCATGGRLLQDCKNYNVNKFVGTVLLQLSGADIKQISILWEKGNPESNVSSVFSEEATRATDWFTGIAPESAPPFVIPGGTLVGKLLLWLER
jgi:type IV pilus assembly protein PilY1